MYAERNTVVIYLIILFLIFYMSFYLKLFMNLFIFIVYFPRADCNIQDNRSLIFFADGFSVLLMMPDLKQL